MKKSALYVCVLLAALSVNAATSIRGDFFGWAAGSDLAVDNSFGSGAYSAITVTGMSGTPTGYKFYSSDGAVEWMGEGTLASANSSIGVADKEGGENLSINASSSKYYTFRIKGYDSWWQRDYVVMETDNAPVGFSSVTDDHSYSGSANITVTITTDATPSSQESIYVRWTTDGFASTSITAASGSGTTYTAIIPPQAAGAAVAYYVFTSTMPSGVIATDPDLCTLRGDSNGGVNYSYTAGSRLRVSIDGGSSWLDADYTTSKAFIDERTSESVGVIVKYTLNGLTASDVELFTNLGRRDLADVDYSSALISADGYADGISPPNGNLITTSDSGAYYTAFAMTDMGNGVYQWSGSVDKCGAYRLTGRYHGSGQSGTTWSWYGDDGKRDHAVVISPTKVHAMTLYELNALTINADSASEAGRSTFADLSNPNNGKFNLNHMNFLQANCLWFQPIHPSSITTRGDSSGYTPGSPYATRDYFAVSKWYGAAGTEASAMTEFTNFVAECDSYDGSVGTVNIILDGVFNHTSWDAKFGQGGVDLGFCSNKDDSIGSSRPGWYSHTNDYGNAATYYNGVYDNDFAVAPDRSDFGKWNDAADLFFGNYAALVVNQADNSPIYNEDDWYDYSGMSNDTKDLWKYFAYYADFWLDKTGHPGNNNGDGSQDDLGIDGLRCDFGQGLPPQFWEYFINHTRSLKWNFIFMAETLDGGIPGYRSNRHFDILNENIVFQFKSMTQTSEFKDAYESRRNSYNGGSILLNLTGHDEEMPFSDAWKTASRHGCNSMIDGLPMMFYGQERGIIPATSTSGGASQGFELFELNFGKYIPHFKQWNKATYWDNPPASSTDMDQWYGRVNWARLNSPALRSMNRYFLSRTAGGDNAKILAAAKYEQPGIGPVAGNDVVLAFALILDDAHTPASDTYDLKEPWGALGLDTEKRYNIRNVASSDASKFVWSAPRSGQDLYDNGIWVSLTADSGGSITDDGTLVQYLRVVEVSGGTVLVLQ
ncbi:MAG: hypothetical protein PF904_16490 [Kiritimatiellae bacterium]|nr:hypothetical protein [Kiritimatiellia bacterium]